MKQTLWVISELFPPEETSTGYIMGEIANIMTKKYNVKVICGPEVYDDKKKIDSSRGNKLDKSIEITRVKGVNENKRNKLSRIKKFLGVSYQMYKVAKEKISSQDKVLMVSNPFPLIILMTKLKRKKHFELTMLVHDVFPETLYTEIALPSFAYSSLSKLFNKAYASTDTLISLGRDMTEVLSKKISKYNKNNLKILQIENWGQTDEIYPIENPTKKPKEIVIGYSGNIGTAQGVSDFTKIISKYQEKNIRFSIWGTGAESEAINTFIKDNSVSNVSLNGPYRRSEQLKILNECDISLVTLVKGMYGLGVPSKTYNILAAGKPILFIGPLNCEIALLVKENNIGFCFDNDDIIGLETFLAQLNGINSKDLAEMGKRSRELAERKYSKESILDKFLQTV